MRGHIEQRGPASWRLRVNGVDPETGQRIQPSRTVQGTKSEAEHSLALFLIEVGKGHHASRQQRTVGELTDAWLAHARNHLEPTSAHSAASTIRLYIKPRVGALPLAKLEPWDLDALYSTLLASGGKGGRPLSPATVKKVHAVLRSSFKQGVRWRWIAENPAVHVTPPSAKRRTPTQPDPEEVARLLRGAAELGKDWLTFLQLSADLGTRRGEQCALRWSDVDFERREVQVHATVIVVDSQAVYRPYPKTAASVRAVALGERSAALLADHRLHRFESCLAQGVAFDPNAFVFAMDEAGQVPWHPHRVTRRFMRLRNRLGIRRVRLHDLRHYVGTELIAAGLDDVTVAGRLGHASPAITKALYAHRKPARDRAAAEVLDQLLATAQGETR